MPKSLAQVGICDQLPNLVKDWGDGIITIPVIPSGKFIVPKLPIGRALQTSCPVGMVGEDGGDVEEGLVVVDEKGYGIVKYPFKPRSPAVRPYRPEGSDDLSGNQMSLPLRNIVENIMSDRDFSGVKVDTFDGVGDRFRQIPVGIEDGKAAFIIQNQVL